MVAQWKLNGSRGLMKAMIAALVLVVLRSRFLSSHESTKCQTSSLQAFLLLSIMDNCGVNSQLNDGVQGVNEATVMLFAGYSEAPTPLADGQVP